MAKSKIQPLADRVLVKRLDDAGEQKVGGIIIPDTAKESPRRQRSSPWVPVVWTTASALPWK